MSFPVDRSIRVSAPHRAAHTIFSTSSEIEDVTAELPMFALTFTAKALPMIIGSLSGWRWFAGMTARPRATSSRTSSTGRPSRAAAYAISGVTIPALAQTSCVAAPSTGSGWSHPSRVGASPASRSITAVGSVYGPDVSYRSRCSPLLRFTRRTGTRIPANPGTSACCLVLPWIGPTVTADTGAELAWRIVTLSLRRHDPDRFNGRRH
ncbi:hypothetical protein GALL_358190 [mine drainage metagenome]|uniref:Uncharacterized protein n=1 Tax=mine drainage metagenome TaxID=410659 RepID=A0A1J5R2L5_9ZZZZ